MAFYELTQTANQVQELKGLKQALIVAVNLSANIQRQMDEMTDAQLQSQFGIPVGLSGTAFKSTINSAVTALEAAAIQNLISQLG